MPPSTPAQMSSWVTVHITRQAVGFYHGKPIFYGLGSFPFHTGHLGVAHGNWVGLLAKIEEHAGSPEVFVQLCPEQ